MDKMEQRLHVILEKKNNRVDFLKCYNLKLKLTLTHKLKFMSWV